MKLTTTLCILLISLAASAGVSHAALIVEYHMGEAGSLDSSNRPKDSSGNGFNITQGADTFSNTVVAPGSGGAPGSTAALNFAGTGYYYANAGGTINPGSDWTVNLWAKPTAPGTNSLLFGTNGVAANGLQFNLSGGNWQVGYGSGAFLSGSAAAAGTWAQLTVTSIGGISTFSINGISQGTFATPGTVNWSGPVIAVTGPTNYTGALDEITINSVVPEPGTLALFSVAMTLALTFRRRAIRS